MSHECALGINIEALVTQQVGKERMGRHYMLPCHNSDESPRIPKAKCDKCSLFTAEEIARQDAETEAFVAEATARLHATIPLIEEIKTHRIETGSRPCPACKTGEVHWSLSSYNNHVHMKCTTSDCINFME